MTFQDAQGLLSLDTNHSRISRDLLAMHERFMNSQDTVGTGNDPMQLNSTGTKVLVRITAHDVELDFGQMTLDDAVGVLNLSSFSQAKYELLLHAA